MVNGRGKDEVFGVQAKRYLMEKVSETLTGEMVKLSGAALEWGTEHEELAITFYEQLTGLEVEDTGLVPYTGTNTKLIDRVGGSPDGLVDTDGMIEVKCPYNTNNHINNILENKAPTKYLGQVQGGMWLNDRKWCDFISFDPRVKQEYSFANIHIIRVERDDNYIQLLEERLVLAVEYIDEIINKLKG